MKQKALLLVLLGLLAYPLFSLSVSIRSFDHKGFTRIVFEGTQGFAYDYKPTGSTLEIRLDRTVEVKQQIESFRKSKLIDRVVHQVHKDNSSDKDISVFQVQLKNDFQVRRNFVLEQPFRLVFDLEKSTAPRAARTAGPKPAPPQPQPQPQAQTQPTTQPQDPPQEDTQDPEADPQDEEQDEEVAPTEKKRELISTICIDPGHGGTDLGAVGRSKTTEKELTLKVGMKLKRLIESRLGLRVVMTREKDEEVSLNSRVSRANNQKAQIFVSIHVNSSFKRSARGPETYYVSLKATDQDAFLLSQKENSSFKEDIDKLANGAGDELKMILWSMAQNEYIKESAKLADYIQGELNILLKTENRGVKQAPFRVLMRAAMPAVLVEVAFVSNSTEEKKLQDDAFLDQVTRALYDGISKFIYYHNNIYAR